MATPSSIIETLPDAVMPGVGLKVILVRDRMPGILFRGKELARAGNSCRWSTPEEMVRDPVFRERFGEVIGEAVREHWPRLLEHVIETVTLPFDVPIGWVTMLPRECVNGARMAPSRITPTLRGMLVAPDDAEHPAPRTNLLTMTVGMRVDFKDRSKVAVRVLNLHVGEYLNVAEGDLTGAVRLPGEYAPRKIAFFHPDHPGGDELVELDP